MVVSSSSIHFIDMDMEAYYWGGYDFGDSNIALTVRVISIVSIYNDTINSNCLQTMTMLSISG